MTPRLPDDGAAESIRVPREPFTLLHNGSARGPGNPFHNETKRLAPDVTIDRAKNVNHGTRECGSA